MHVDHRVWTYCPTSYNPVAPWRTPSNNMTLLPQLVWVDLPANFSAAALGLTNCTFSARTFDGLAPAAADPADPAPVPAPAPPSCAASAAQVSAFFGPELSRLSDELAEGLSRDSSPTVLEAFQSSPPPTVTHSSRTQLLARKHWSHVRARLLSVYRLVAGVWCAQGTFAGLRAMLSHAHAAEFRAAAAAIWDGAMQRRRSRRGG